MSFDTGKLNITDEVTKERFALSAERILEIAEEKRVMAYQPFFASLAEYLCGVLKLSEKLADENYFDASVVQLTEDQKKVYGPLLPENYPESYANHDFCVKNFGEKAGKLLAFLYYEEMQILPYVYEKRWDEVVIRLELFLEIYTAVSGEEDEEKCYVNLKDDLYWYVSDYGEDAEFSIISEQFLPENDFALKIVMESDLCKPNYLFRYGEYISDCEIKTAEYLSSLPEEKIALMADTFTEGYRKGFLAAGKDITIKKTVTVHYPIGFERVIKKAVGNFEKMGLKTVIYRSSDDSFRKRKNARPGYSSLGVNRQALYDHREDLSLFLDGHLITRKLECRKAACEEHKKEIREFGGPAYIETFGEKEFTPKDYDANPAYDDAGRKLSVEYRAKAGDLLMSYIHMEERSFTIIAFPVPEIGENFEEIFNETIRINTLDYEKYQRIQTALIDTLNRADRVHVQGRDGNETELTVELCKLINPETQAKFENCVADVNIPVGEVFTSPVLEGTNGILHVKKVYINGLKYENLRLEINEGITKGGSTTNLPASAVEENIMFHHPFLPMGEFAIGTNTTAYAVAQKYDLFERLPILIAEKTGPHFAFGDTCYSNEEEVKYVNPDGKEMVAKENTYSKKRHTNPEEAYFHCHTDITIPYEEIGVIEAVLPDGERIPIIKGGRFVLPGTEALNEPLSGE